MKRILAVFLTLAMALNVAPVGAFAAADSNAASIVAIEETDESASSRLDEQTARAIASDPFLQQANAASQEQNSTIDTSDVSMEATNSFGKLLLNGMDVDKENGSSSPTGSNIQKITLNGRTATVDYTAAEDADLVVGIYADDAEEQMVASGTVAITAMANGTATVAITGDIPDYYVIKGYLFDKAEHAPLCNAYEDTLNTESIEDLKNATIDSFPKERTLNLDDDPTTNFAVVNRGVTLLTQESNPAGKNQVINLDNNSLSYTITNASSEIKNLQINDILTYEYEVGELLIVRISAIDVSGDTVTIQGDDTLEITDVFENLKIEAAIPSGEFVHSNEGMDSGVTYLGVVNDSEIEQTNKAVNVPLGVHAFSLNGTYTEPNMPLEGLAGSVSLSGSLTIEPTLKNFDFFIVPLYQHAELLFDVKTEGTIQVEGKLSYSIPLGEFAPVEKALNKLKKIGVTIDLAPKFVVETSSKTPVMEYTYQGKTGFEYDNFIMTPFFRAISQDPGTGKMWAKSAQELAYVKIYVGVEIGPELKSWQLLDITATAKMGLDAVLSATDIPDGAKHLCTQCAELDEHFVTPTVKFTFVIFPEIGEQTRDHVKLGFIPPEIKPVPDIALAKQYWSRTYDEFAFGSCPHIAYRVDITFNGDDAEGKTVYEHNETPLGKLDSNNTLTGYLEPGSGYVLTIIVNGTQYTSKPFNIADKAVSITFGPGKKDQDKPEPVKPTPDISGTIVSSGTCGVNSTWKLTDNGTLIISGSGKMKNYIWNNIAIDTDVHPYEWYFIKKLVIEEGITSVGEFAFAYCSSLSEVALPSTLRSIGNGAFMNCEKLNSIIIPNRVTLIDMNAFAKCSLLESVVIPAGIKEIPLATFCDCYRLKDVYFCGTEDQWKNMLIAPANDRFMSSEIQMHYNYYNAFGQSAETFNEVENSITTGKTSTSNNTMHAVFNGLTAGEAYAVIVSKSAKDPFNADNLIYVNQKTAGTDGVLDVPFTSSESGAAYVVACRRGNEGPTVTTKKYKMTIRSKNYTGELVDSYIPGHKVVIATKSDDGNGNKFNCWRVVAGDVTLADPTSPSTSFIMPEHDVELEIVFYDGYPDSSGNPSGGDDGGGAAILLIGGVAAAAAVAGVVMMMPVEVSGTVKLADQPVANASVQVLQGETVKAETATDATGHFALKVRRGNYTLRVQWTDAEGQPVMRTVDFKAPNANLNVAA